MARRAELVFALFAAGVAASAPALATGVRSPFPVAARGRLDLRVATAEATAPWSWDAQSRSPFDGSRFMVDVTAGQGRTGVFYLKGASSWRDADAANGRVDFRLDQGDYLYHVGAADRPSLTARIFGDERRYFTGELGTALMDDDTVERFDHRYGLALDGTSGSVGAGYLVSGLDEGAATRVVQRGAVRVSSSAVHAALAYQTTHAATGEDHAVAQAEAAGYYRRATAIISYAQSGFGRGVLFPSGSFDTGAFGGGHYLAAVPDNSATFGEARVTDLALTKTARIDAIYRYQGVGASYVNDLATAQPGTVSQSVELYALHRQYALDGGLVYRDEKRFTDPDASRRVVEADVHGFFTDNVEARLSGGAERREFRGRRESDAGFVEGAYRRELQRFMGGLHARVDGIGEDAVLRGGVESRIDWSPTSALTVRWIVGDGMPSDGLVFARLEFRPTKRTWVTLAYGRDDAGNGPDMLADPTLDARAQSGHVVTLGVRGDF